MPAYAPIYLLTQNNQILLTQDDVPLLVDLIPIAPSGGQWNLPDRTLQWKVDSQHFWQCDAGNLDWCLPERLLNWNLPDRNLTWSID